MIATERGRRIERAMMAGEAESVVSRLLRRSRSFAARVRRETELVDRAWEEAAEATAASRMTEAS
jgi:hypothetical protein